MNTTTNEEIGRRIKGLRLRAHLTQKDLASELKKLGFSTGHVTLSNYESGKFTIPSDVLLAIVKILDCSLADITGYVVQDPLGLANSLRNAADLIEEQHKEISRLKETSC